MPTPHNSVTYVFRGSAHLDKGEFGKAITDFTEAIRLKPEFAEAYAGRGDAYKEKGDQAKAEADFARAKVLSWRPE